MSILDVKFKNNQAFLLKHHGIGLYEYESQISKIDYEHIYEGYRNIKDIYGVEQEMFPPVNMVFFSYLFIHQNVPNTHNLLEEYFRMYQNCLREDSDKDFVLYNEKRYRKKAVIARILRTYPSLIRDFHFYLLLLEDGYFQDVIYSCRMDIRGNDITVRYNNKEYVLSLYVDTGRSRYYKEIKNRFRHRYSDNEVCVPLDFSNARKIGDFFVYNQKDVEDVKTTIKKLDNKNVK